MISYRFQQPNNYDVNSKFKAVFIYNFTRYFDWPQQKKSGNFIIHVIGKNDNLISELKSLAMKASSNFAQRFSSVSHIHKLESIYNGLA